MKPVLFLLNDRWSIKQGNTTSTLMLACHRRGHPVFISDVVHLQASSSTALFAEALHLPETANIESTKKLSANISKAKVQRIGLSEMQAIFIRTTPGHDIGRTWAHRLSLEVMRFAYELGIPVINNPTSLQKASSKLYTVCLPEEYVPKTLVCHSLNSVLEFSGQLNGPFVMKPLLGSQGRDVFFLDGPDSLNTRQVVDILGRTGYLVVQEYVPEATEGDIRVLILDKSIIPRGTPIGIRRTPAQGERRSNISLGGSASIVELTSRQTAMCKKVAKYLHRDGIRLAGLDLIGDKIVEVNVFSPSGLQVLAQHFERDLSSEVLDRLLAG